MRKLMRLLSISFICTCFSVSAALAASLPVKPVTVKRVIDSYTLEVASDRKTSEQVRLLSLVPTKETLPTGLQKAEELTVEQDLSQLTGKTVYLEFDNELRDDDNHLLAYVWLKKPKTGSIAEMTGQMLNARLLLLGYAEWSPNNTNYKYIGQLLSMETDAFLAQRGLWAK